MAKHLQQLDLFGNDTPQPVHIAAPASTKAIKKSKPVPAKVLVVEEPLPSVSRTSMHYKTNVGLQKEEENLSPLWKGTWRNCKCLVQKY